MDNDRDISRRRIVTRPAVIGMMLKLWRGDKSEPIAWEDYYLPGLFHFSNGEWLSVIENDLHHPGMPEFWIPCRSLALSQQQGVETKSVIERRIWEWLRLASSPETGSINKSFYFKPGNLIGVLRSILLVSNEIQLSGIAIEDFMANAIYHMDGSHGGCDFEQDKEIGAIVRNLFSLDAQKFNPTLDLGALLFRIRGHISRSETYSSSPLAQLLLKQLCYVAMKQIPILDTLDFQATYFERMAKRDKSSSE